MPTATTAPAAPGVFALDAAWRLHPQVAIRPEAFGALAYHFGTRRLSFLKSPLLRDLVESLEQHGSARDACVAAGLSAVETDAFAQALGTLAETEMIVRREDRP